MDSSEGFDRGPSRPLTRTFTNVGLTDAMDPEVVPSSLSEIAGILRVANDVEHRYKELRVAYLCRFYAFDTAHKLDPNSTGRGVRQFKTALLSKLERDVERTKTSPSSDARVMRNFYEAFYEKYIKSLDSTNSENLDRAQLAQTYRTAKILFEVWKAVSQTEPDDELAKEAETLAEGEKIYSAYNILPLGKESSEQAIRKLPEIMVAVTAVQNTRGLHFPEHETSESKIPEPDLLDWLWMTFGFQRHNVENQREHLILLLANAHIRSVSKVDKDAPQSKLADAALDEVLDKLFENYKGWCSFLGRQHKLELPSIQREIQQRKILYLGLYLLIWGEAANLRFMPESLCYIFHRMASELHEVLAGNVSPHTGESMTPAYGGEEHAFLKKVVRPLYDVIAKEVSCNKNGKARHSAWRNYDDLNEYFWSTDCFRLNWPMREDIDFFTTPKPEEKRHRTWIGKTQFVEVRSFWHIFRSFDRMWAFLILTFQAMIIIAWNGSGPITDVFHRTVLEKVLSIFITAAILRLIQAIGDFALSLKAWRSMKATDMLRYILKIVVATAWVVILPVCYAYTWTNPFGLFRTLKNWFGQSSTSQSLYITAVTVYLVPDGLSILVFLFPNLRRKVEQSNALVVQLLLWWSQPRLYIGRGMHENQYALLKYTLFWVLVFISKCLFSYYLEVRPLIGPSKEVMQAPMQNPFEWHEFFPRAKDNWGVLIAIWAPIVMVYFMDTQIWYAVWSTISGGITGALQGLGEIRTLAMLKSRFSSLPGAFNAKLVPSSEKAQSKSLTFRRVYSKVPLTEAQQFCHFWNEVVSTLRKEDYINNEEKEFLLMPDSSDRTLNLVQYPPFLLAGKIHIALDTAKDFTEAENDGELMRRIQSDDYMICAIKECYVLFNYLLQAIVTGDTEKRVINDLTKEVDSFIRAEELTKRLTLSALPLLYHKFVELLQILDEENVGKQGMVSLLLQDMLEVYTKDVRKDSNIDLADESQGGSSGKKETLNERYQQLFSVNAIGPLPPESSEIGWKDQIKRLRLLLRDSAMEVPTNLEAQRRISFFANSLFMDLPDAPKVRNMLSFSVLTPYYQEEVLYNREGLEKDNEDGVSILYYLQKIYPDEWKNFLERTNLSEENLWDNHLEHEVREWASYRAQTLTRTVRGMMYYRRALELQAFSDMASESEIKLGYEKAVKPSGGTKQQQSLSASTQAVADMKFTYVATCQLYGQQKRTGDAADILKLMKKYPALRVAYIDEVEKGGKKQYYSVLVKGIEDSDSDQEIYRIELPGKPILGEGKPENQNHAIIFTRGEALQAIDMNQDNYLEEAFKMRNLLEEFLVDDGLGFPAILGMREHIFTGSVSSLAGFMSNQESSFVTIGQRVLANPLKVRFHYGHPDVFDRLFHITRGGISKASRVINLSEDIFAGFNTTLRRGNVTHHEYIQVGKGRDVGLNQISLFEAKIANGNGEQTLSRDIYRLGHRFDFFRMLSVYYTTVGFYFSTLIVVLIVYVFLYGRIYLALSGLEHSLAQLAGIESNSPLQATLASQSAVQIGLLMALPMVMEIGLERGYWMALSEFVVMQLQLASVFFTFSMGTRVHFYGRTLLHGGAKYRSTGRGFVVFHAKFAENYRLYSRSHFTKGLELLILLIVYNLYGAAVNNTTGYFLVTFSLWFMVGSWLFAPFMFNPSGFEWQKIVDDWTDWIKWVFNRGGVGVEATRSWESWWEEEQAHLATSGIRGQLIEILLSTRFLLYQYGLVYHLNITQHNKSILVYGLSWVVLVGVLVTLKVVSRGRRNLSARYQLFFRLLKGILLISVVATLGVLFAVADLTVGDILVSFLAFIPSGWAVLQIAQTCKPLLKKVAMWGSVKALARGYEIIMGSLLFAPVATFAWFPFISDFQTRLLFNQAFSRGLQISRILAGRKDKKSN